MDFYNARRETVQFYFLKISFITETNLLLSNKMQNLILPDSSGGFTRVYVMTAFHVLPQKCSLQNVIFSWFLLCLV